MYRYNVIVVRYEQTMKIYLFLYRPTHMPTRDKLDAKLLLQLSGLNRSYQLRYTRHLKLNLFFTTCGRSFRHADNGQSLAAAPHTHRFEDSGTRVTLYTPHDDGNLEWTYESSLPSMSLVD